jgi:P-type Ca2+ transporter type 2C
VRPPLPDAYALDPAEVGERLATDLACGLAEHDAAERLRRSGPNELERATGPAYAQIAARQLLDPLVGLLVAAAVVSAAIGETVEAIAIGLIVVLNAVFGFLQELGAERAVLALRASLEASANVVRDGVERTVSARELVAGDVIRVREGDRVPADARVLHTHGLEVDESLLTGESAPVGKSGAAVALGAPLAERSSMLYAGTSVTRGSAFAVVVATGALTEQGTIARLADEAEPPPTPLQARLGRLARWMVLLGVGVTIALGGAMLARGEPLREAFLVGVSVAVAAVPEGLAATVTIALALGSREMARRGAIVRELSAIETIGEATVVCTDKTGTLTENRLRVERSEPASGCTLEELLWAAAAASAADVDPVDRALAAAHAGDVTADGTEVLRSLPFEASRKRATVLVRMDGVARSIVKGAPDVVLGRSSGAAGDVDRLGQLANAWAADGMRVLAVAARDGVAVNASDDELETDLRPLGLIGLADPLRPTAAASIRAAGALGLEVRMLTGDHELTAAAIAGELGLPPERVHARFTPADKLALVAALQREGAVVAVTGDGVNDAPALRQADVGVAMGRSGTEAAREASSLVLTDDDFATIVAAVEEGRRIAGNVRAFLAFLLSANLGEVLVFAVAIAAGLGPPLTVVQVLAVNLLTDGPPAVALARDPAGSRARVDRGRLFGPGYAAALAAMGVLVGLVSLAAFLAVRQLQPDAAQTAAFATIALAELALVFTCRSVDLPSWRLPPNPALRGAVVFSLLVVVALVYAPFLQEPLGTVALHPAEALLAVLLAVVPAAATEAGKAVVRVRRARRVPEGAVGAHG